MIPSEKEIARLITAFVGVSLQYATDEPPEPEEWPIATIFNMDRAAHAIAEKLEEGMMDADDTMLRYWRIRRLCIELHSDWALGIGPKWFPGVGVYRLLNLGPLCLYWRPADA